MPDDIDMELERLKEVLNNVEDDLLPDVLSKKNDKKNRGSSVNSNADNSGNNSTSSSSSVELNMHDPEIKDVNLKSDVKKEVADVPKDYSVASIYDMVDELNESDKTEVLLKKKINQLIIENQLLKEKIQIITTEMKLKEDTLNNQFNRFIESQKEYYQKLDELKIKEEELRKWDAKLKVQEEIMNEKMTIREKELSEVKNIMVTRIQELKQREMKVKELESSLSNQKKILLESKTKLEKLKAEMDEKIKDLDTREKQIQESELKYIKQKREFEEYYKLKMNQLNKKESELKLKEQTLKDRELYVNGLEKHLNEERVMLEKNLIEVNKKAEELKQKESMLKNQIILILEKLKAEYEAARNNKNKILDEKSISGIINHIDNLENQVDKTGL